jgi:hypothetical protein
LLGSCEQVTASMTSRYFLCKENISLSTLLGCWMFAHAKTLEAVKKYTRGRVEQEAETLIRNWPKDGPEIPIGWSLLCLTHSRRAVNICRMVESQGIV